MFSQEKEIFLKNAGGGHRWDVTGDKKTDHKKYIAD